MLNSSINEQLAAAADVKEGDLVLEIGPGTGSLTNVLVDSGATVIAIEKVSFLVLWCFFFQLGFRWTVSVQWKLPLEQTLILYYGSGCVFCGMFRIMYIGCTLNSNIIQVLGFEAGVYDTSHVFVCWLTKILSWFQHSFNGTYLLLAQLS